MKPVYKIMFFVSIALLLASLGALLTWGLQLGVDFKGGSVLEVQFAQRPVSGDIITALEKLNIPSLKDVTVNTAGTASVVIKSAPLTEAEHQQMIKGITDTFKTAEPKEVRFDSVGPAIGSELKNDSITAILLTIIAIAAYIALMFRAMRRTLSPWVLSLATMVALAHDVLIPLGLFAVLGHFKGVEIGAVFVAAILTIMGYSISDTVVVFDRVRENIVKGKLAKDVAFGQLVHVSIMQTIVRSINTNITTLLSLVAIYFFGGESIQYFALALIVGIFSGAYSSIFVASPILVWMSRRSRK